MRAYGKSILKWAGKKAMQRVQKQFDQRQSSARAGSTKVGETEIKSTPSSRSTSQPRSKKTVGEYVDYEEID